MHTSLHRPLLPQSQNFFPDVLSGFLKIVCHKVKLHSQKSINSKPISVVEKQRINSRDLKGAKPICPKINVSTAVSGFEFLRLYKSRIFAKSPHGLKCKFDFQQLFIQ